MHNQTTCNLFYIHLLCLNLYIGYSSFKYTRAYTYFTVRKKPLFHHIKTIGIRGSHSKKRLLQSGFADLIEAEIRPQKSNYVNRRRETSVNSCGKGLQRTRAYNKHRLGFLNWTEYLLEMFEIGFFNIGYIVAGPRIPEKQER